MSKPLIVIPARMASTRFPGKPLAEIAGVSMVRRTAKIAADLGDVDYLVAPDHKEIFDHCETYDIPVVMTDAELPSGSDRALAAAKRYGGGADIIVNLQGDAPFTDPSHVQAIIQHMQKADVDITTPAIQLDWADLDKLRADKLTTPFSGTTVIESRDRAIWFSKTIIPAIRKEKVLRAETALSPVLRHVGLYGFRREALERFTALPQSTYENLEGLEQLRALENGMSIGLVKVKPPRISSPGIDTRADLARAEALIEIYGDPFTS